ncbi:MAG: signal peptidase II [Proteobacteria bacterium]|nr:signal peptidase II [Pseudomonadota bacterium]
MLVGLDQLIKYLVRLHLTSGLNIELIPNLIQLTHQENRGISFSMLSDLPTGLRVPLLAGVSTVVVVGLCIYVYRSWSKLTTGEKWGFSLIISGAIGNLLDRAIRQQVTDYMHFHFFDFSFFVNNLADDLISIGFVIMLFQSFIAKKAE